MNIMQLLKNMFKRLKMSCNFCCYDVTSTEANVYNIQEILEKKRRKFSIFFYQFLLNLTNLQIHIEINYIDIDS